MFLHVERSSRVGNLSYNLSGMLVATTSKCPQEAKDMRVGDKQGSLVEVQSNILDYC